MIFNFTIIIECLKMSKKRDNKTTTTTHTTTKYPGVADDQIVYSTPTKRNEWAINPKMGGIQKKAS
jgi:hypothetical protein